MNSRSRRDESPLPTIRHLDRVPGAPKQGSVLQDQELERYLQTPEADYASLALDYGYYQNDYSQKRLEQLVRVCSKNLSRAKERTCHEFIRGLFPHDTQAHRADVPLRKKAAIAAIETVFKNIPNPTDYAKTIVKALKDYGNLTNADMPLEGHKQWAHKYDYSGIRAAEHTPHMVFNILTNTMQPK